MLNIVDSFTYNVKWIELVIPVTDKWTRVLQFVEITIGQVFLGRQTFLIYFSKMGYFNKTFLKHKTYLNPSLTILKNSKCFNVFGHYNLRSVQKGWLNWNNFAPSYYYLISHPYQPKQNIRHIGYRLFLFEYKYFKLY